MADTPEPVTPPAPTKHADRVELRMRIDQVKESLLEGMPVKQLIATIQDTYEIGLRMAYKYYQKARSEIESEVNPADKRRWLREHLAIRRHIRKRAAAGHDLKMELEAAKDEANLLGLYVKDVLPPLEAVLNALPPDIAAEVRSLLEGALSDSGDQAGR